MVTPEKTRLVVFDVEGVLIPRNRFVFEIGKTLGVIKLLKMLFWGFLYEAGLLKLESALTRIFRQLEGAKLETLEQISGKISSISFLQNIGCQLKTRNCKIALISSGLPTVIVQRLGTSIGADYAYGIEAETKEGRLTGKIWGDAMEPSGKLKILCQILALEGLTLKDCVVVADDRNNRCIFMPGC